eukprot:433423_1
MSQTQWNYLDQKAGIHLQTSNAQEMIAGRGFWKYYGIKENDMIKKEHLMGIMIYCNFDLLQYEFSKTCRKLSEYETNDQLKTRHSNFHWLGRILRETVTCFRAYAKFHGTYVIHLYHGINQQFLFRSLIAEFKGPLSTTTEYAVALNFCAVKGMILDLKLSVTLQKHFSQEMNGFDCQWLSDFSNEQEIFFIGGMYGFRIHTIIDTLRGINYIHYARALNCITQNFTSAGFVFLDDLADKQTNDKVCQQMACRLLSHELWRYQPSHAKANEFTSFPDYFKNIMRLQFTHIKWIYMDLERKKFFKHFFGNQHGWIELDSIQQIFPNVEHVVSAASGSLHHVCKISWQFVRHQDSKVKCLMAPLQQYESKTDLNNDDAIILNQYKEFFKTIGWKVSIEHGTYSFQHGSYSFQQMFANMAPGFLYYNGNCRLVFCEDGYVPHPPHKMTLHK